MVEHMRRDWLVIGMALLPGILLPGLVTGAPDPAPPPGFSGLQYIDGRGCVFVRDGLRWTARLDPEGLPLCGFPPSLDLRRLDPEAVNVLPPGLPAAPPDPAAQLAELLAEGMRDADLALPATAPAAQERAGRPGATSQNPLQQQIAATLAQRQAVTREMAIRMPDPICARLGYRDGAVPGGLADPTGFCTGLRAPDPGPPDGPSARPSAVSDNTSRPTPPDRGGDAAGPERSRAGTTQSQTALSRVSTARPQSAPTTGASTGRSPGPASVAGSRPAAPPNSVGVEMIPPGARYVQLGAFADDATAMAAIADLVGRGLPVVRTRISADGRPRVVMAGPFTDRSRLVEVLNMLRQAGWPGAVAR